jgi:hypothetical protein
MHSKMQTSSLLALATVGSVFALPNPQDADIANMDGASEININDSWAHRAQMNGSW